MERLRKSIANFLILDRNDQRLWFLSVDPSSQDVCTKIHRGPNRVTGQKYRGRKGAGRNKIYLSTLETEWRTSTVYG